ncbi:MAG: hypothetical protein V1918_09120 [Planctomycetota bacterium]
MIGTKQAGILAAALLGLAGVARSAEVILPADGGFQEIVNGGFESPRKNESGIPYGWSMWGTPKVKEDFTRDTRIKRSGEAGLCYRQPRGTRGYVITTPALSARFQPRTNYLYTVYLYAEKKTEVTIRVHSYSDPAKYTDYVMVASARCTVEREWQKVVVSIPAYSLARGLNTCLMLNIQIRNSTREDQTLWVDDATLQLSSSPYENADREDLRLEERAPLEHRLSPGPGLTIRVDANQPLHKANRRLLGIAFHMVGDRYAGAFNLKTGEYCLRPSAEEAIRSLQIPLTRLNTLAAEPWPLNDSLDKTAFLAQRVGIPASAFILELEEGHARTAMTPEEWSGAVRHSVDRGYGFFLWEVANEPFYSGFFTPETYAGHVREVSAAIKAVQPGARIGLAVDPDSPGWGVFVLKQAAGSYDFVCPHLYAEIPDELAESNINKAPVEDVALAANFAELRKAVRMRALLDRYNPGRRVAILDSEWGLAASGGSGEPDDVNRNGNIVGAVHRAVRLIYCLREGLVEGMAQWQLLAPAKYPGFGIVAKDDDRRFLLYYLNLLFSRYVGAEVLDLSGTAPYYRPGDKYGGPVATALATLSGDGRTLFLVLANGTGKSDLPCEVAVKNFPIAQADGRRLFQKSLDAPALVTEESEAIEPVVFRKKTETALTFTCQAHSVYFLALQRKERPASTP